MRIDVLTIFPGYLRALELSLAGKAQRSGLLELRVHDLRRWAHDRHRTVDDTPYGGGAGMVMKPEPWGEALDEVVADAYATLVVPTAAGEPFRQPVAHDLATRERLVFACGRYEGIDQRVVDHARGRMEVRELSLGDYVLNGGEVAALAMVEAVVRLLPGFLGNADSLTEESHGADGLLEYPVYTKPPAWRGLEVPEVLLSGDHGRIAAWRREESRRRTANRRPDLLHASHTSGGWEMVRATRAEAGEILTLQLACWVSEALAYGDLDIAPLREELDDVVASIAAWETYVVRVADRLVGSVRGRLDGEIWDIGRLMVAPDLRGRGLGRVLLEHAQHVAPPAASTYRLLTEARIGKSLRGYQKAGFSLGEVTAGGSGPGVLTKRVAGRVSGPASGA